MNWSVDEFSQRAEALAKSFVAGESVGGTPLTDLVEKVARDSALGPEAIRTLSRETNKAVFAAKYATTTGKQDKRVDWDLVDPETVIGRLQAREVTAPTLKVASYPDLPDPRPLPPRTKVAEAPKESRPPIEHLRKLAKDLPMDLKGLDYRWQEKLSHVLHLADGVTFDREAFEKNALGVLGEGILPELNALRVQRGLPEFDTTKVAAERERFLGIPDELTRHLLEAHTVRQEYAKKYAALMRVRELLGEVGRG